MLGNFADINYIKHYFFSVAGICCRGSELVFTVMVEDGSPAKRRGRHEGTGVGKIRNIVRFFYV